MSIKLLFQVAKRFSTTKGAKVGFIGLGNMGGPMAVNLVKNGYTVFGYDLFAEKISEFAAKGVKPTKNFGEVAEKSEIIITMLRNHNDVKAVCEDKDYGIFKKAKKGALIIDSSTIIPSAAKELSDIAAKFGHTFVDAPVSGGVGGATNGTLTFMLGAKDQQLFDKCKDILQNMGKNIISCGGPGSGQIAKMCNNLALAIQMVSIAEATNLGKKSGIDVNLLFDVMKTSTSRCWSLDTYHPAPGVLPNVPSSRNYDGGFACALMLKDLKIAQDSAKQANAKIPVGDFVIQVYEKLVKNGLAGKDFGVIYDVLAKDQLK